MYDKIGGKLKTLAEIFCTLGIVLSLILGVAIMFSDAWWMGFLVIGVGGLVSWLAGMMTYTIGSIEENIAILTEIACRNELALRPERPDRREEDVSSFLSDL